jgi:hypothetical protein
MREPMGQTLKFTKDKQKTLQTLAFATNLLHSR